MALHMTRRRLLAWPAAAVPLAQSPFALAAEGDDYPNRNINYVVPYAPGGLSDIIARLLAEGIRQKTGKVAVIDYKPGAGGTIAAEYLVRQPGDGYTIMGATNGFFGVSPHLYKLKYDAMKDLLPVAMIGDTAMSIVGSAKLPAKNLQELIAYAKANPGKISYGSAGIGTVGHLCGEYLKARTGIHIVHIPYRGSPAAVQAAMAGDVELIFGPEGADGVLAGKLKGIATLGKQRWSKLPDVPTTEESGLPGWALRSWHTVCVPGSTPRPIAQKLNEMINATMALPENSGKLAQTGTYFAAESLAQLAERARTDHEVFGKLIRDAKIVAE